LQLQTVIVHRAAVVEKSAQMFGFVYRLSFDNAPSSAPELILYEDLKQVRELTSILSRAVNAWQSSAGRKQSHVASFKFKTDACRLRHPSATRSPTRSCESVLSNNKNYSAIIFMTLL